MKPNRKFIKGRTYFVFDDQSKKGWAIIRPSKTQEVCDERDNTIIKGVALATMNTHWDKDQFIRGDGQCTYPMEKCEGISVYNRQTRPATDMEKAILDLAIETGEALTEAEMKSIKRHMSIEELGI